MGARAQGRVPETQATLGGEGHVRDLAWVRLSRASPCASLTKCCTSSGDSCPRTQHASIKMELKRHPCIYCWLCFRLSEGSGHPTGAWTTSRKALQSEEGSPRCRAQGVPLLPRSEGT